MEPGQRWSILGFFSYPTRVNYSPRRFSTAPMMEWTDRHWRVFARGLTRKALLYYRDGDRPGPYPW